MQKISPFKTLDIFRGFAALWVVMDHSCDRWLGGADPKYLNNPIYAFSLRGQLGVMLFFVISGYCITAAAYGALVSGKSIWRYSFERVRRIYPPYLATLLLTALSFTAIRVGAAHHWIPTVNHLQVQHTDFRYWIGNLLLLQSEFNTSFINVVFWSLGYEIVFYAFVGIFIVLAQIVAKRRGQTAGAAVLVNAMGISTALILIGITLTPTAIFPFDLWHLFALGGMLFFFLEWTPQTVLGYSKTLRITVIANFTISVLLTIAYLSLRVTGGEDIGHPNSRVRSIVGLLFVALLIPLKKKDSAISNWKSMRPLMWLGAFSYSLYLIHPVVLPYIDVACRRFGLNGSRYIIAFFIQVALSVMAGRIFYLLVERHFISKRQVARHAAEHVS